MKAYWYCYLFIIACLFFQCDSTKKITSTETKPVTSKQSLPFVKALDGRKLFPPKESASSKNRKDSLLQIAKEDFEKKPDSLDNIIWLGRRTAYLWRYQEAIDIYTKGLQSHPNSAELYRHRGHRYISVRQLDKAIADFEKAGSLAEGLAIKIEQDGIPNKKNIPLSNLQFNIYYHWALAHYLKGDFEKAAALYEECLFYSINSDLLVATADWLYMTYRRLEKNDKAERLLKRITPDLNIIENQSYFNRLLMYKGLKKPEDLLDFEQTDLDAQLDIVTQGYGVGNWYFYNKEEEKAVEIFHKLLATQYWSAFGYIAAEADLNNQKKK